MNGFWKWYLGVWKWLISLRWVRFVATEAATEYIAGLLVIIVGVLGTFMTSPWFLLLIVAGINIAAHGFWRLFVKEDR